MLLDVKKLGDAQPNLLAIAVFGKGIRTRLGLDECCCPRAQLGHLAPQMFQCFTGTFMTKLKQLFKKLAESRLGQLVKPFRIPFVGLHCLLKNLMQDCTVNVGLVGVAGSLHSVLKDGTADAFERIGYDCCRDEMVGMNNQEVVCVVNGDLTGGRKGATNNVDVRSGSAVSINPRLAKSDGFGSFVGFVLDI